MNFDAVDIISFNDENGNTFPVRDIKPMAVLQSGITIDTFSGMEIDEVVSRREFYGDDTENMTGLVVEKNVEQLMENDFNLAKIKRLNIPVAESE